MKKIVIAMDSMKGCLGSLEASRAVAGGLSKTDADVETVCVPVADGGEGTAEALTYGGNGFTVFTSKVSGPLGEEVEADWYMDKPTGCAFIDMASAAGLTLIDEGRRNPLYTTTYGVGQLIMEAVAEGARRVMLGLGGSATVDAGLGACQAMGIRIMDCDGRELPHPFTGGMLKEVGDIDISGFLHQAADMELFLLSDVTAPFTGTDGASCVFGPQKGATPEIVNVLEEGMEKVRRLIIGKTGIDLNAIAGSGAAGGAAGGLMALAGGVIRKGAPTLLDMIGFDTIIEGSDLIITGEGSSDTQTLMGKLPYEILQRGKRRGIPVWLLAGRIEDQEELLEAGFDRLICINSQDIVKRSATKGNNPMDPDVAARRLGCIIAI